MNIRFFMAACGLASLLGMAAYAQPAAPSAPPPATPPATPPTPQPFAFQSALQDYQPYTDNKIVSWKDANDTTARIGGWRAYAKEASAPLTTPTPATAAVPATGAAKP